MPPTPPVRDKPGRNRPRQASARLSEPHLLEAQEIAALGSWELDIRTREIVCSPETLRIFGWPENQPADIDRLRNAIHPDDRTIVDEWLADAPHARSVPSECHFRILRSYEVRTLLGRGRIKLDDGLKIIGTVHDVTEHILARRSSEENAQLRRGMFENAN